MSGARSYLFLQGPVGPFFDHLGRALRARGHRVGRVNLNGGDRLQWRSGGAIDFRGEPGAWPAFIADLATRREVSDLVMFGDCRPRHRIAQRILAPRGVRTHVLEEGYFRPDWITLEPEGVNGRSRLPRDPDHYRQEGVALSCQPWPDVAPIGPAVRALVGHAIAYYAGLTWQASRFRHHRTHRPEHPAMETVGWLERGLDLRVRRRRAQARQAKLLTCGRPFFVLALQLDADMQVRRHSPFAGMAEVIARVVASFATAAPGDALLVVKSHPLDPGLIDHGRVLSRHAHAAGIGARVLHLDGGDLPDLLAHARGLVVVNSTTGLSGIHRGVPTLALGRAIYDLPGLTHGAALDIDTKLAGFWGAPSAPDIALYRAFRRVVMARTQINGSFYTARGMARAVPAVVARLSAGGR